MGQLAIQQKEKTGTWTQNRAMAIWGLFIFVHVCSCVFMPCQMPMRFENEKGFEFLPLIEAISNCFPDVTMATLTCAVPSRSLPTVTSSALLSVDRCSTVSSGLVALVTSNNPGFLN